MKREFAAVDNTKLCGSKFHSDTPAGAAAKMFNILCGKSKKSCNKTIKLMETDKDKIYKYKVSRVNDPKEVMINGVPITFKFSTKVKSMK